MAEARKIKYLGIYSGPSFGGGWGDLDSMPGFTSLDEAKAYFKNFYDGATWYNDYHVNADDLYVLWEVQAYSLTPGSTSQDTMDLYGVEEYFQGTWMKYDTPTYRLEFGERGGVVVEKF